MLGQVGERFGKADLLKIFSGSAFIFGCRIVGAGVAFITQVLMARWMGADELGVYVLAFSWLTILAVFSVAGLNGAAMRFIGDPLAQDDFASIRGFLRRSRQIALILSVLIGSVCALLVQQGYIGDAEHKIVFYIALSALPIFTVVVLNNGIANAFSWFSISFLPNNVIRPTLFLIAVAVVWYTRQELSAATAMALHWVAIVFIAILVVTLGERAIAREVPAAVSTYDSRLWLRTSLPIMMMILFNSYFPAFTVIVAGAMLSNADIAVYNIGFRIALLVAFGLHAIDSYAAPDIMRLHSKGETRELKQLIDRITRMRFLVALGSVVVFVLLGRWILGFFGEEFTAGYWVLIILGLTQLVQAAVGPVARLLSMTGHQDQGFYISTVSLAIAGVLILLLTPPFGVVGTAVAALMAITVWSIWMSYIVATRLGLRPSLISFGS